MEEQAPEQSVKAEAPQLLSTGQVNSAQIQNIQPQYMQMQQADYMMQSQLIMNQMLQKQQELMRESEKLAKQNPKMSGMSNGSGNIITSGFDIKSVVQNVWSLIAAVVCSLPFLLGDFMFFSDFWGFNKVYKLQDIVAEISYYDDS